MIQHIFPYRFTRQTKYIYVFSLTGKPIRKYVLDHYVYGISVDELNGIIVATDVNSDEPVVKYKMD